MPNDTRVKAGAVMQESLATLIMSVVEDEFKSIKDAFKVLEASLASKIDTLEKKVSKSSETLAQELSNRIDEISRNSQKLIADQASTQKSLDTRLSGSFKEFSEKSIKDMHQLDATIEKIHKDVINEMAFAQTRIDQDITTLRSSLQNDGAQIQYQANEIKRISTVLGGFARIFSDPSAPQAQAPVAPPPPAPVSQSTAKPTMMSPDAGKKDALKPAAPQKAAEDDLPSSHDLSNQIDSIFNIGDK